MRTVNKYVFLFFSQQHCSRFSSNQNERTVCNRVVRRWEPNSTAHVFVLLLPNLQRKRRVLLFSLVFMLREKKALNNVCFVHIQKIINYTICNRRARKLHPTLSLFHWLENKSFALISNLTKNGMNFHIFRLFFVSWKLRKFLWVFENQFLHNTISVKEILTLLRISPFKVDYQFKFRLLYLPHSNESQ